MKSDKRKVMAENKDKSLIGNEKIEEGIRQLKEDFSDENLAVLLTTIRKRILDSGQFVVAVDATGNVAKSGNASNAGNSLSLKTASYNNQKWFVAYTSFDEEMKGNLNVMSGFLADIGQLLDMTLSSSEVAGLILNPYGNMLTINKQIISVIKGENSND